jgi:transcriptional regulator with XRE-family HTH domain
MGPTSTGGRTFSHWLSVHLKARKLTQRQLARKSGVNHSTISRLMRGEHDPSLRTANLLARSLGMADRLDGLDREGRGSTDSPVARVEHALRLDDHLTELHTRHIMSVYLTTRLRLLRIASTASVSAPSAQEAFVVRGAEVPPRSTT